MEINTTTLLPYILDLLSRQPDLCKYFQLKMPALVNPQNLSHRLLN